MKYEFLEHTADIKTRVFGKRVEEIFENTALAISEILSRKGKVERNLISVTEISGESYEEILYRFIEEMIYLLDAEGFLVSCAKVEKKGNNLKIKFFGDESKKYDYDQIKSATYHDMYIKKTSSGFEAQFVVDV